MKRSLHTRRAFAGLLSLVMLAGLLAVPALADEDTAAPVAVEAPAKEEVPVKDETPAKEEAPAAEETSAKAETPVKEEVPTKEETPTKEEAPAKEETPAQDETPAKDETPAPEETDPAPSAEPTPVQSEASPTPRPSRAPAAAAPTPAQDQEDAPAPDADETEDDEPADQSDDGFTVDWDQVGLLDGGDWQASRWGIARGEGGYWVYLENDRTDQARLGITYYNSASDAIGYQSWVNRNHLLNEGSRAIQASTLTVVTEGSAMRMEGFLPDSFFKDSRFILSSGSVTLASEDIPVLDGATAPEIVEDPADKEPFVVDPNASYRGITIDGDFSDWDAVPRYPIQDFDFNGVPKDHGTVDQVSVLWDGDMIYLLLVASGKPSDYDPDVMVGDWASVTGAGPNDNGQFAIRTDLEGELLIQPTRDGAIAGVSNAQVAVNNREWAGAPHMWEIAIPADKLPPYQNSFDFGIYMAEPTISGVTDLQGGKETGEFSGIVYDGNIQDWAYYPSYRIEYATEGTQDIVRDAEGALWSDNNILYGYASTNMLKHLEEDRGGCFLDAIVLAFNGDRSYKEHPSDGNFYPRIISFESGAPVVVNDGTHLAPGDYVFYIFDERTAPEAPIYDAETNTTFYPDNAYLMDHAFGQMTVHVDGVRDHAEFELYLDRVAEYIGQDADTAFKVIEIQWGRLGQQWISYGGTPTGPMVSVALLLGAVCVPMGCAELKKRRQAKAGKAQ